MVQIAGKYKHEKNENFAEYLKAMGVADDLIKKADIPGATTDITVDGNTYSLKSSSGINVNIVLGEEFEEPTVLGVTLKVNLSTAKLEGNIITVTSKAADGRSGTRTYEFTDKGYTVVLTTNDITAKRYYVRQ